MDAHNYKQLKEEFVSNLPGTTMLEIAALSAVFPAFVLLRQWGISIAKSGLESLKHYDHGEVKHKVRYMQSSSSCMLSLALDFIFVVIPSLACVTILADQIYIFTAGVFFSVASAFLIVRRQSSGFSDSVGDGRHIQTSHLQSISSYRFIIMLVTCISILAVDFKVFPRRYAKTETYGTGLMDVGVGSFVFVNALVSRQARNLPSTKKSTIFQSTIPLVLLGIARLISTKGVDYQVHVGEYGVHWNFFFTLAAVSVLTSIMHIPAHLCWILGTTILLAYQLMLLGGLNQYLNSPERKDSFLSLNKEGIFSLIGYWGLYLLGVSLGYLIFDQGRSVKIRNFNDKSYHQLWAAAEIWILGGFFWILALLLDFFVERVSRRTCNFAYIAFVLAVNLEGLGIVVLSDFVPGAKLLLLEELFNKNMMGTFLLANVLTGLVNLSMDTLFATTAAAYATLILYLVLLVVGVSVLNALNVKIRF